MTRLNKHQFEDHEDHREGRDPEQTGIPVPEAAVVLVSSEAPDNPIDHAFDGRGGPGGSRWRAGVAGDQTVLVAFGTPQMIRKITVEIEEREVSRTQELALAVSADNARTYRDIVRQEYNFSPSGSTFEREEWTLAPEPVTHVRLRIKPDKGRPEVATLTTLQFH